MTKKSIKKREQEAIEKNKAEDESYLEKLYSLYLAGFKDIQQGLSLLYLKYAGKEGLSIDEAMDKISKADARRFAEKAKSYSKEKNFSKRSLEVLGLYTLGKRVTRLDLMKRQTLLNTINLATQEEAMLKDRLEEVAKKEVVRQAGILGLDHMVKNQVFNESDKIIYAKFHKARFSDRIWANQRELQRRLERGIDRTILKGENPKAWAKDLEGVLRKEMLDKGRKNARYMANRIAITETSRVQGDIALECFKRGGYEKYIYIAELDHRTCSVCEELDGQIFLVSEAFPGVNMYPMHPMCRCSTAAYMEEEKENSEDIFTEEEEFDGGNGYNENKETTLVTLATGLFVTRKQFGKKSGKHMKDYGLNPKDKRDRVVFERKIKEIVNKADEIVEGIDWLGQGRPLRGYIKEEDVVLQNSRGFFVTILKGGVHNKRVKKARGEKV